MTYREQFSKELFKILNQSVLEGEFHWKTYFRKWFRQKGQPYFFLFKKNLAVTNTQYTELFSLIALHSDLRENINAEPLFYTTTHIKDSLEELMKSLLDDNLESEEYVQSFFKNYVDIFLTTIAVDLFYGSCAIFLPPGIHLDLEKVVYESGYIHSAGRSLFIRNIEKARKADFYHSLNNHLNQFSRQEPKFPFIVYSHEDFSDYDKDSSEEIKKGIDHSKIHIDKMSMGRYSLAEIIMEMQSNQKYSQRLIMPKPGNYKEKHQFSNEKTIWLIHERSISRNSITNVGQEKYYVCYEQQFKNSSPFYYFDENKPAWKSHTTLPHTLTAALLNTARLNLNDGKISDPFGGTGTTWLETKRLGLTNDIQCSDLSPATKLIVQDNLFFFLLPQEELSELINDLKRSSSASSSPQQYMLKSFEVIDPYSEAFKLIEKLRKEQDKEKQEFFLSQEFTDTLKALPFITRLVFYVMLRAELRFQNAYRRKATQFSKAYDSSLEELIKQMEKFKNLKAHVQPAINFGSIAFENTYFKTKSIYSFRLTPSFIFRDVEHFTMDFEKEVFSEVNATDLASNSNDLIICDPPYGFNTAEDDNILTELYQDFIDKAIDSLKRGGQLIICLPAKSYTGRGLPNCTRSDLVSRVINIKAKQKGRIVYIPARSLPDKEFFPPYYWESDKALQRRILHYYFF